VKRAQTAALDELQQYFGDPRLEIQEHHVLDLLGCLSQPTAKDSEKDHTEIGVTLEDRQKIPAVQNQESLPEPQFRQPTKSNLAAAADGLGISEADVQRAAIIDVGPVWFTLQLACGDAVLALTPDMGKLAALNSTGITGVNVFGLYPAGAGADLEVRSFAPGGGIPEDPVWAAVTGVSLRSCTGTTF
jgi:predicted PhzF superfamily epimerase YddE/YHI9